jgi:hypothetical protein
MAEPTDSSFAERAFSTYNANGDLGRLAKIFRCGFACNDVCKIAASV